MDNSLGIKDPKKQSVSSGLCMLSLTHFWDECRWFVRTAQGHQELFVTTA